MFSDLSDINRTSDLSEPHERLSRGGHRVVSVFLGSIMVFGFLNNLLVLVLFCRFKTLRTPVNMLLLNISVSDMLVCVCGTTLSFASSLRTRWLYGRHGCMWYGFVNSCFGPQTPRPSVPQTLCPSNSRPLDPQTLRPSDPETLRTSDPPTREGKGRRKEG